MQDTPRRLFLRVGVKLMFLVAVGMIAYVLLVPVTEQTSSTETKPEPLRLRLTELPSTEFQRLPWQGGNLILLRRGTTEIYIAFDRGTGMGCPLQWFPASTRLPDAPIQPWPGGLRDSCDGSWYDMTGKVFKGQAATGNLESPAYRITGELLEIGTNSDNPALVK